VRIDQYLWAVRYFKSRSKATRACREGKVRVKDVKVKASFEVFPGDTVRVRKDKVEYLLEVLAIPDGRVGAKLKGLYVADKTPAGAFANREINRLMNNGVRERGTGRPTKKERRDWDEFWE